MYAKSYPDTVRYSNRFGSVEISPVSEVMDVSSICKSNPVAVANEFTISDAEKIALITGNDGVQICPHFFPVTGRAYLILHYSSSTASVCSVRIESFTVSEEPSKIISGLARVCL